jgi:hypothetical protein
VVRAAIQSAYVIGLLLGAPSEAVADPSNPSAADKETSRELYAQGIRALEAGDYAAAERACRGAYDLVSAPTGAVCWARALEGLNQFVEARDAYLAAARYPSRSDEPPVFVTARGEGRAGAARVEKRIVTLVLDVSGVGENVALSVTIDGLAIPPDTARLPRKMNPGRHVAVVASPGYQTMRIEVAAFEGQETHVNVPLTQRVDADEPARPPSKLPAFVALGVGGVGLVVGSIFGAMALSDASGLNAQAGCPSNCPPSAQPQIDTLHGHQWVADVALGVGVVGLALGAVLFLHSRSTESRPATSMSAAGVRF